MPNFTALDLTVVIPVKNEEANLQNCLNAIGADLAQKVVIVDSGSTDKTKSIAAQNNIEIIDFQWNGTFPKKRNWYLRNYTPKTKWVLFLDADEYLTEDFKKELRKSLTEHPEYEGFWLNYTIYFMGKKLKGGYPLKKLALFQVGKGEYERIEEDHWSHLDMEIHEHPVLSGKVGAIKSKIDHRDFRGIAHYVAKHDEYALWEAERYFKLFQNTDATAHLTWKQKLKYRLMKSIFIGPVYFIGSYIVMGGFRDGRRGFAFAVMKMAYFNQIYCLIKEKTK